MIQAVRPAGADDGHVVYVRGGVLIPVGHPHAALAVLLPGTFGSLQGVVGSSSRGLLRFADGVRDGFAIELREGWLGIEEIDVAGTALHEEEDDGLGERRMVRGFRGQ